MPKSVVKEMMPASAATVFAVLHDYGRRLEWDTLLQQAYLEPEFTEAGLGAVSVCKGRMMLGGIALRTVYVSFQPGRVAAVKMLNEPPFFRTFAASIRHFEKGENLSELAYEYNFTAKPRFLARLLHPAMNAFLAWETRKRLASLRRYLEKGC